MIYFQESLNIHRNVLFGISVVFLSGVHCACTTVDVTANHYRIHKYCMRNVAWKLETKMEIFEWFAKQLRVVLLIDLVWRFRLINLGRNWFATVNVISVTEPDQEIPRRWNGNWPFTSILNPIDSQDIWRFDLPVCIVLCVRVSVDNVLCFISLLHTSARSAQNVWFDFALLRKWKLCSSLQRSPVERNRAQVNFDFFLIYFVCFAKKKLRFHWKCPWQR